MAIQNECPTRTLTLPPLTLAAFLIRICVHSLLIYLWIFAKEDRQRRAQGNTLLTFFPRPQPPIPIPSSTPQGAPKMTHEKIPVQVFPEAHDASISIAHEIARLIREKAALGGGQKAVLGLATGSTPIGVYAELVRLHQTE